MNDLRSRNRALAAVPDEDSAPTSTPPRVRPDSDERNARRMSRRQSIAERAKRLEGDGAGPDEEIILREDGTAAVGPADDEHRFRSSRPRPDAVTASATDDIVDDGSAGADPEAGPSSRPTKRRDAVADHDGEMPDEEDKFPWHFQFDDDEPEELQASSPLLSRAFRATIG